MKWFFGRVDKKKEVATAVVFIDYRYWYSTFLKMYHEKPDLVKLRPKLEKQYRIKDIMVFTDFTDTMQDEVENLGKTADYVINTHQNGLDQKEWMREFIILNHMYQYEIENPKTSCYMLFSNNGCFCPVLEFLRKRQKQVLVLGVRNAFSLSLKKIANGVVEIPSLEEMQNKYFCMIVRNLEYVSDRPRIIPTFRTTVKAVAKFNDEPEIKIHIALEEMIKMGLVIQREWNVEPGRTIKVVDADWTKVNEAGLA